MESNRNLFFYLNLICFQELKDEANAIRLSAELASKKALEENLLATSSSNRLQASSSRLRIREILEKQRVQSLDRSPSSQIIGSERTPFGHASPSRNLWVFR
jgi:hypothetical protein